MLEIFPQNVNPHYPNDRQAFLVRATDRTPMWVPLDKGVVEQDYSLRYVAGLGATADGALQLVGGIGSVEFVLTPNCLSNHPAGISMTWTFTFGAGTPTPHDYKLTFLSATIDVSTSDPGGGLLTTIPHASAAGDRIKVELSNGFRLFINGVLRHERLTFSSNIQYPATYRAFIRPDFITAAPKLIPAPILEGDWGLRPVATFVAPSHGSISSPGPGLQTEYFNGTIPGKYSLEGRVEPGVDIWFEEGPPAGATVSVVNDTIASWGWGSSNPHPSAAPGSGPNALGLVPFTTADGRHAYIVENATTTFGVNRGDVLTVWVWLAPTDTPTEIMIQWKATDSTGFEHRAFWGANSLGFGTLGTPSRRFMGQLPPTNQWVRLEVPASLVDLEGRVLNGISLEFFDGKGAFDQIAKIPRSLQRAESLITMPPLRILGELTRTIQPSSQTRIQTNYDDAQTLNLVTWSILSGGGSISADGVFAAPATPGTAVVRASAAGNQVADLTINVPAIITPNFAFAAPLEQIDFNTNIPPVVTWSSVPSGINSGTGVWTLPNELGKKVNVSVTDGSFTATLDLTILEKFPFGDFVFPFEVDWLKKILVSESEDGTSYVARVKSRARQTFPWKLTKCSVADLTTVRNFWDRHHPGARFIMENLEEEIRLVVRTDSDLKWVYTASGIEITGRVKEAV